MYPRIPAPKHHRVWYIISDCIMWTSGLMECHDQNLKLFAICIFVYDVCMTIVVWYVDGLNTYQNLILLSFWKFDKLFHSTWCKYLKIRFNMILTMNQVQFQNNFVNSSPLVVIIFKWKFDKIFVTLYLAWLNRGLDDKQQHTSLTYIIIVLSYSK